MRIISGHFNGRKITQSKNRTTRPLKDLTKESIFNVLQHANWRDFKLEKSIIFWHVRHSVQEWCQICTLKTKRHIFLCNNTAIQLNMHDYNKIIEYVYIMYILIFGLP